MLGLTGSEMLFYGGIAVMASAGVLAVVSVIIFMLTGRKIRQKLDQDYGEIWGKQKCLK